MSQSWDHVNAICVSIDYERVCCWIKADVGDVAKVFEEGSNCFIGSEVSWDATDFNLHVFFWFVCRTCGFIVG